MSVQGPINSIQANNICTQLSPPLPRIVPHLLLYTLQKYFFKKEKKNCIFLRHLPSCQETDTVSLVSLLPQKFAHLTFYLFLIVGQSYVWFLAYPISIISLASFVKNGQMIQEGEKWDSHTHTHTHTHIYMYRVSREERSIFWEVIVSVILSKKLYMNMCPIPNGFRDRAI